MTNEEILKHSVFINKKTREMIKIFAIRNTKDGTQFQYDDHAYYTREWLIHYYNPATEAECLLYA